MRMFYYNHAEAQLPIKNIIKSAAIAADIDFTDENNEKENDYSQFTHLFFHWPEVADVFSTDDVPDFKFKNGVVVFLVSREGVQSPSKPTRFENKDDKINIWVVGVKGKAGTFKNWEELFKKWKYPTVKKDS